MFKGKTMILCMLFVLIAVEHADFHKNLNIERAPPPPRDFLIQRYVGDWFVQAFLVPRSVPGFRFYTDYISRYILEPNGMVTFLFNYRTPRCATMANDYIPQQIPGIFFLKDSLGDTATGTSIVVATDYDSFAVKWGCVGPLVKGFCNDPYVVAKTRRARPGRRTMKIVEKILGRLFGLRLFDLTRYSHGETCPNPFGSSCPSTVNPFKYVK